MKVKLRVLKGASAGKEIKIPSPKCAVGRGDECHLRPKSDAVSRRHCEISNREGQLYVKDLGSKNGTFVNGKRIEEEQVLKNGDHLQFGPLSFEVVIDHTLGGEKKPKVKSIKEAAARTGDGNKGSGALDESDISEWLEESADSGESSRDADPETLQVKLDETDQVTVQKTLEEQARKRKQDGEPQEEETTELEETTSRGKSKADKKKYGKLPQRPDDAASNSRDAAAEMLRKFFNKR
jgi:pSer/pThr/pTyr-binding forkhead associated (FHA) protein